MTQFKADLRFHGFLCEILTRTHRAGKLSYSFPDRPAIKDAIEACGVPHTEVDLILVKDHSVDFAYQLLDGDAVNIYPIISRFPGAEPLHLSPPIPEPVSFILDVHLGKLARRLRLLGFDCRYRNDFGDDEIVALALAEKRIILTRDRGILKRKQVTHGMLVRTSMVGSQLEQVFDRYLLHDRITEPGRCPLCNGLLEMVQKTDIKHLLKPETALHYEKFYRCRECAQLYWRGAHFRRIGRWIDRLQPPCGQ